MRMTLGGDAKLWRAFGWSWLDEGGRNGALKALGALQGAGDGAGANVASRSVPAPQQDPPLAARVVLLWLELVAVAGAALLLLQVAWVAGAIATSACPSSACTGSRVVAKVVEGVAQVAGLLSLTGWLLDRPRRSIARTLFAFRRARAALISLYFVSHVLALALVSSLGVSSSPATATEAEGELASWRNAGRQLTTLLMAPLTEELFFRGLVLQLVLNRTKSVVAVAGVTSALFALLHLANARRIGTEHFTAQYLALQSAWALLVGVFLSLQVISSGSLAESVLLHAINNLFALHAAEKMQTDVDATTRILIAAATFAVYSVAIGVSYRQLKRRVSPHTK